jgi:hypothetical protein
MEERLPSIKLAECQKQANTIQQSSSLSVSGVGTTSSTLEQAIFMAHLFLRSFESYRLKLIIFIWYFEIENVQQEMNDKVLYNSLLMPLEGGTYG